jgi:hypothetical protein
MPKKNTTECIRSKDTVPPTTSHRRTPTTSPLKKEEENSDSPRPPPRSKANPQPKTPNPLTANIKI